MKCKSIVSNAVPSQKNHLAFSSFGSCRIWLVINNSEKGWGRGDLLRVAPTVRYQPDDSPLSNKIMQEYEKLLPLKKAYFTASGIPWKQQLKWADCCTPRRLLCLYGWRLPPYREFAFSPSSEHVSSAASVGRSTHQAKSCSQGYRCNPYEREQDLGLHQPEQSLVIANHLS